VFDKQVILVGYSGHGYVVADIVIENNYNLLGYTEKSIVHNNPFNLEYLGNEDEAVFLDNYSNKGDFVLGLGNNILREKIFKNLIDKGCQILTLKSLSASVSNTAIIDTGTFINRNVSINAFSKIGKNVILNTACIIEHDCIIFDSVHIAPGAVLAGNVSVGARTFIGANSVIKQGIKIGADVIIGAGSVIIKDIPDGMKVVGNPGHFL
jgi:acetyltransferase EpsM